MSGSPGTVRAGGHAFLSFASEADSIVTSLNKQVSGIVGSDWRSQGAEGFGNAWAKTGDDINQLDSALRDFGNELVSVAGKMDDLNHLHDVLEGLEAAAAVGVGLSFFTFGISDAEAAAAAAEAATVEVEITAAEEAIETAVASTLDAILENASRVLLEFGKRFAIGAAVWGGGTAGSELVFTGSVNWTTVLNNAIAGGLAEGTIPATGGLSVTLAKRLLVQGWLQGTLEGGLAQGEAHGGNPLTWDWGAIDLNAAVTSLENIGGGIGLRVGGKVAGKTITPHLPESVQAKLPPPPPPAYVGKHRAN